MARRRVCLMRGRTRVPFVGYKRAQRSSLSAQADHMGVFDGLPPALRVLALRCLAEAEARRPLANDRMKYLGRLEWVAWFNTRHLLELLRRVSPNEFERAYYRHQTATAELATLT